MGGDESTTDEPATSAVQDQWQEIAAAIRGQLARIAGLMPAMEPDEAKAFVEAAREALGLESEAALYDHAIETRRRWLERLASFGE